MPREALTEDWSFDPGEGFDSRVVEGSKQFVRFEAPIRTIWVDAFGGDPEMSPEEVLEHLASSDRPADAETFRETGDGDLRFASWYREDDEERPTWGLTGYVVREGHQLVVACYVDEGDEGGRDWALGVWRSLRFDG